MNSLDESVEINLDRSSADLPIDTPEPSSPFRKHENSISTSPMQALRRGNVVKPDQCNQSFQAPPSAVTVHRVPKGSAHANPMNPNASASTSVHVQKKPRNQTASTRRSSVASMSVINLDRSGANLPLKANRDGTKAASGVTVKKLLRGKSSTRS